MRTLQHRITTDTRYVLIGFPVTVIAFVLVVAGVAAGLGGAVAFVGLPVLAATAVLARKFADAERAALPDVVGRPLARPEYPAAPAGAGWFRRTMTPIANGQAFLDLLHAIVALPFAIVSFVLTAVWWAGAIAGLTFPIYGWALAKLPGLDGGLPALLGLGDGDGVFVAFNTAAGLLFALTLPAVVRIAATLKANLAEALLTRPAPRPQAVRHPYEKSVLAA
ncbi:sensor domain-containing protein [Nonomuraea sp. NPDC050547]|uniref:sensor domain-containing protein n=1 Tax=Nonomuraea sp. NPDC050547 TaxID=3364368 RepID=UPI00379E3C4D